MISHRDCAFEHCVAYRYMYCDEIHLDANLFPKNGPTGLVTLDVGGYLSHRAVSAERRGQAVSAAATRDLEHLVCLLPRHAKPHCRSQTSSEDEQLGVK
ncbi:hypothetical protein GQ600_6167 [Phytophthora cactorum]|nr:hypothetical protein GQ600_6167 [Phytophthora cactorum]